MFFQVEEQRHNCPFHQTHKTTVADQARKLTSQVNQHMVLIVTLEGPIPGLVKVNDDRHDLAQGKPRLSPTLAKSALQLHLFPAWLKNLAKIIDRAEDFE